jgi:hypothetical protein
MSAASAAMAAAPYKVRSRITKHPSQRHGRSAEARRVRDLYTFYSAQLGNPVDVGTQALILAASEAMAIAEITRASHIAGKAELDAVVRAEGMAARALRRLGLNRAAPPAPRKSFAEKLAEMEAARQAAEGATAAEAAEGVYLRDNPLRTHRRGQAARCDDARTGGRAAPIIRLRQLQPRQC